ncbi:collagen-like triple helix repeat-containing protein [Mumia quercus]|uniref:collagen-like triple helix repeat-containing protein n=1 Tax=Mumia quercus TaxID=2976125 RepID=UPI0021D3E601|nr:collagen-like protein [Mumia quercus]
MSKLKKHRKSLAIVAASVLAIGALSTGGAVAADKIGPKDIRSKAVRSGHIKDGEVKKRDLSPAVKRQLEKSGKQGATGKTGPAGPKGEKGEKGDPASDVKGGLAGQVLDEVEIAKIGGSFAERATEVGAMTLKPGTYLVNGHAKFDRINDRKPSSPVLQLAIRGVDGSTWGEDYGTAFTGEFPAEGNLEQTASSTRVVVVPEETEVRVLVFGYNKDTSEKGSGNYTADVSVSAVRVG